MNHVKKYIQYNIELINIKYVEKDFYYIGRDNVQYGLCESDFHNPYILINETERKEVYEKYKNHIRTSPELIKKLPVLIGKTLGCYCLPKICHGEALVELLEEFYPELARFSFNI